MRKRQFFQNMRRIFVWTTEIFEHRPKCEINTDLLKTQWPDELTERKNSVKNCPIGVEREKDRYFFTQLNNFLRIYFVEVFAINKKKKREDNLHFHWKILKDNKEVDKSKIIGRPINSRKKILIEISEKSKHTTHSKNGSRLFRRWWRASK